MNNQDTDRLLEQNLSGDPPRQVFRAQVLLDSTAALVRHRQVVRTWRLAALSAAAVVIASVSFLLGRSSMGPRLLQPVAEPVVADAGDTVVVPKDLVACLSAARLFKQLGMEDRMNRALACADRLLPRGAIAASSAAGPVFPAGGEVVESQGRHAGPGHEPGSPQSVESMNSFGKVFWRLLSCKRNGLGIHCVSFVWVWQRWRRARARHRVSSSAFSG